MILYFFMIQSYESPGTELFEKLLIYETVVVYIPSEISRFEIHMKKKSFRVDPRDFFILLISLSLFQNKKSSTCFILHLCYIFRNNHCCGKMLKQLILKKQKAHNILTHKKP